MNIKLAHKVNVRLFWFTVHALLRVLQKVGVTGLQANDTIGIGVSRVPGFATAVLLTCYL